MPIKKFVICYLQIRLSAIYLHILSADFYIGRTLLLSEQIVSESILSLVDVSVPDSGPDGDFRVGVGHQHRHLLTLLPHPQFQI